MPKWLIGLIAVACTVVIGFVGDQFWTQHQARQIAAQNAQFETERETCLADLNRYYTESLIGPGPSDPNASPMNRPSLKKCFLGGYIIKSDADDAASEALKESRTGS